MSDYSLSAHLMTLYVNGALEIEDKSSPLAILLDSASDDLMAKVIEQAGRLLLLDESSEHPDGVRRVRALWLHRRERTRVEAGHEAELAAFGYWFCSHALPDEWLLRELIGCLKQANRVEPLDQVAERLSDLCSRQPELCAQALPLVAFSRMESWDMSRIEPCLRQAITSLLASDVPEAVAAAQDTANKLLARGYFSFRNLANMDG